MGDRNFEQHKRIVIKVGTTTLTYPNGKLNLHRIEHLAWILSDLKNQGKEIVLVSSGAIAVGSERLGLSERPRDIRGKQAASAVGQGVLMQIYENFFNRYNQKIAQILLTKDVISDETRKQNAHNTFTTLLSMGVIPIVNENDTVSIEELEFSDNDTLSAYVACLIDSDMLIILSDIDAIYDKDPKINSDAVPFHEIERVTDDLFKLAGGSASSLGTGGMYTKVSAAQMATNSGIDTLIASGEKPEILFDILSGKRCGTLIKSAK